MCVFSVLGSSPWKQDMFSVLNENGSTASVQIKHNVQMRQNCGIWEHTFNVALRELLENQQNKCSQKCNQRCGSTEPYGACALLLLEEHSS